MSDEEFQNALDQYEQDAESRRRDILQTLEQEPPDVVQSVDMTTVVLTMNPKMLPHEDIDAEVLLGTIEEKFHLNIDPPEVLSHVREISEASDWSKLEILKFALRQKDVDFSRGRVSIGRNSYVSITAVSVTSEKILVMVDGRTEIGEYVAAEVFEAMWRAAGAPKRWESREVQENVQLKSYGTLTRVNLGCDLLTLLAPSFVGFLNSNLRDGMAAEMISRSSHDSFAAPADVVSTFNVDELDFKVNVFDQRTGRAEQSMIKLSVMNRDDMGRGVFNFFTELPTELHFELVERMASVVQQERDKRA
ncbi:hypothetical protein [Streptomyces sp. 184]|uniref:hypothetical protein n=1 Tax=Streptomyces sp. 184 TaxID=1827526 RepID=UPI0038923B18